MLHWSWLPLWVVLQCVCGQDDFYFRVSPEEQSVRSGDTVRLRCQVSSEDGVVVTWSSRRTLPVETSGALPAASTAEEQPVRNSTRVYQSQSDLIIGRVDAKLDSGIAYICTATNVSSGFSIATLPVTIHVLWIGNATHVTSQPASLTPAVEEPTLAVTRDRNVTLICRVEGSPELLYEWFHNGVKVSKSKSMRRWVISRAGVTDSGTYTCSARNSAGVAATNTALVVTVVDEKQATPQPLQITREAVAVLGSTTQLTCTFRPTVKVDWFFDDLLLTNNSKYQVQPDGQLSVVNVLADSQGWYKCKPTVDSGQVGPEYGSHLKIAFLDEFQTSSIEPAPHHGDDKLYLAAESSAELNCAPPDGLPAPTVWWQGPHGRRLTTPAHYTGSAILTLTRIRPQDSGVYTCHAKNIAQHHSTAVNILVTSAPVIQQHPSSLSVNEGDEAVLGCSFVGAPAPATDIRWLKNGEPLRGPVLPVAGPRNSTLTFAASVVDAGEYLCLIETIGHRPALRSHVATLQVRERLQFRPAPVSKKLELASTSKVHCRAGGWPSPVVRWVKEGQPFFNWPQHIRDVNGTLHFDGVLFDDRGHYTCVATNAQGIINATIHIDVIVLPQFTSLPENLTQARVGHSVELHCRAEGEPPPTVQWDKDAVLTDFESDRFAMFANGTLVIHSVQAEDQGRYGCTAGNAGGFKRAEIQLVVQDDWRYSSDHKDESMGQTVLITLGAAAAYIVLSVGLLMWCRCKRRQHKMQSSAETGENATDNAAQVALLPKAEPSDSSLDGSVAVAADTVSTGSALGSGRFGQVLEGRSTSLPGRRLLLRCLNVSEEHLVSEFQRQIDMFQSIRHANLTAVYVASGVQSEPPRYLLVDYPPEYSNLKKHLLATTEVPPTWQLDSMVLQLARGMQALADARLVHRDLGARNLLVSFPVDDKVSLKVSSLGLDKEPFGEDYFTTEEKQPLPLRWLPREAVVDDQYSTESDVWMFACTVWEVFHGGRRPWTSLSDNSIMDQLTNRALVWDPAFCQHNTTLQSLLARCWSYEPDQRPSFQLILASLQSPSDRD